jgi:hypothetical protein
MKKTSINILILTLALFFITGVGNCMEKLEEDFLPIEKCTDGRRIDEFLSEFKLKKVNKMVLKIRLDEDSRKTRTLTTISDMEKVTSILSAFNKVKCSEYVLSACEIELWLYENKKLRLKVAISVDKKYLVARFFRAKQVTSKDVGYGDFFIIDEKLCSWLDALIKEHLNIPMDDE